MRKLIILLLLIPLSTFANNTISMTKLLSNPELFNGIKVQLIGVANLKFEGNILCDSKEHLQFGVTKNCIWLSLENNSLTNTHEKRITYNGKYIIVQGTINSKKKGHMGLNSATLENITRYDLWEN